MSIINDFIEMKYLNIFDLNTPGPEANAMM